MRQGKLLFFVVLVMLFAILLAACGGGETATPAPPTATEEAQVATEEPTTEPTEVPPTEEPTAEPTEEAVDVGFDSVCLVTDVGKVNDGTFNQYAFEGMMKAVEEFNLESTYIETTAQTDYEANITSCINDGYDAIVTVGFLMQDTTLKLALENPNVYFIGIDQGFAEVPDNLAAVTFREDQAGFLVGALAASVSESNIIAGVYGIEIPPVRKFRNGFEQGAKYVNPDIQVLGVYIDSFTAPDRGAAAAEQFIGEGADVVFGAGGPTGSGGIKRAAELGVKVIGVDQDEYFTTFGGGETPGAENLISSAQKRVDNSVYLPLKALVEGTWAGGNITLSAENDGVAFAPPHDSTVPQEATDRVNEILAGLKDGSIDTGVDPVSGELLSPPEEVVEEPALPSIAEIAASDPNLTTVVAALQKAGLVETLSGEGSFTVFAPTNAAFEALPTGYLDIILGSDVALNNLLLLHVAEGALSAEEVAAATSIQTLNGASVTVTVENGSVYINGAKVIMTDIQASNGVVHVIDAVILPR